MKNKLGATLLAILLGIAGLALAAGPASADTGSEEMAFVQKLNELRSSHGLAPLATKGELFDVARAWSGRMAGAGNISHNPDLVNQVPSNWMRVGENVGMGPDVQLLHDAFVASPLHFKNMIDPDFESVGVGVVHGAGGIIFVTVNFMKAKPADQIIQTVAPVASPAAVASVQRARSCAKSRTGKVVCRTAKVRRVPVRARRAR